MFHSANTGMWSSHQKIAKYLPPTGKVSKKICNLLIKILCLSPKIPLNKFFNYSNKVFLYKHKEYLIGSKLFKSNYIANLSKYSLLWQYYGFWGPHQTPCSQKNYWISSKKIFNLLKKCLSCKKHWKPIDFQAIWG